MFACQLTSILEIRFVQAEVSANRIKEYFVVTRSSSFTYRAGKYWRCKITIFEENNAPEASSSEGVVLVGVKGVRLATRPLLGQSCRVVSRRRLQFLLFWSFSVELNSLLHKGYWGSECFVVASVGRLYQTSNSCFIKTDFSFQSK